MASTFVLGVGSWGHWWTHRRMLDTVAMMNMAFTGLTLLWISDNGKKTSVGSWRPTTTTNAFQTQQKGLFQQIRKIILFLKVKYALKQSFLSAFLIDNVIVHIFAATPMWKRMEWRLGMNRTMLQQSSVGKGNLQRKLFICEHASASRTVSCKCVMGQTWKNTKKVWLKKSARRVRMFDEFWKHTSFIVNNCKI